MNTPDLLNSLYSRCKNGDCEENGVSFINFQAYANQRNLIFTIYHPDKCDNQSLNCDCLIYIYNPSSLDEGIMIFVELKSRIDIDRGILQIHSTLNNVKEAKSNYQTAFRGKLLCLLFAKKITKSGGKEIRKQKLFLDSVKSKLYSNDTRLYSNDDPLILYFSDFEKYL